MKRTAQIAAGVIVVLIVVILVLPLFVNANSFKPGLESALTKALGREVKVGDLKLSAFSGAVTASDLSIADDPAFGQKPFLTAKSLKVSVQMLPLIFSRRLAANGITIDQPDITMLESPTGTWNFSGLGRQSAPKANTASTSGDAGLDLSVKLVKISDGRITIGKAKTTTQPMLVDKVNAELHDFSATSVMPFSLSASFSGGGQLNAKGSAGPLHTGDVMLTPGQVDIKVSHLDLALAGVIEGATGMGGIVALDANAKSDGQSADITGKITADQLKLVKGGGPARKPVGFDFVLRHDLRTRGGSLTRGDLHAGNAVAHVTGTYASQGETTVLNMNVAGTGMPVPELESILPAVNVVLPAGSSLAGGTADMRILVAGPTDRLVATGSIGVHNTTLRGFDLGGKMAAIQRFAGMKSGPSTEIQTLSANVKASQSGGEDINDINLVVPSIGTLTGSGTISPTNALDFRLIATVRTGGLLGRAGNAGIPVAVKGTASNPVFVPDVKALATEQVQSLTKGQGNLGGILGGILGGKKKK